MIVVGLSLGLLVGCGSATSNSGNLNAVEASEEVSEEKLFMNFIEAKVTEDKDRIIVDIETNLPDDTEIILSAISAEDIELRGSATVSDGKLNAQLEGKSAIFVMNGTYEIDASMQTSSTGLNSVFYEKYGDMSSVEGLVDGEVAESKYTSGYVIDFGIIGEVEIAEGISIEKYSEALEEASKAEEAERKAEEEAKAKAEEERKAKEAEVKAKEAEVKAKAEEEAKAKAEEAKAKAEEEAKARAEEEERKAEEEAEAKEKLKASAKEIRFAELEKNPDKYAGEFVKYQGEIIQIIEDDVYTNIRLAVTKTSYGYSSSDIIYVYCIGTTPFVKGDIVTVYAGIEGSYTYESQAGFQITLPLLFAEIIE